MVPTLLGERLKIIALVVGAVVLLATAIGAFAMSFDDQVSVPGTVVRADPGRSCEIRFTDDAGKVRSLHDSTERRTIGCDLDRGQEVTVYYAPGDPEHPSREGPAQQRLLAGICLLLVVPLSLLARSRVRAGRWSTPPPA